MAFSIGLALLNGVAQADDHVDFLRDVRPILSDTCYTCHGPDAGTRKARLRLDTRDGLFSERDLGAPVVPGSPEDSTLVERILSDDEGNRMPPPKSGKNLTANQRETLARWIAQGAEYRGHWAYQPATKPTIPAAGPWAANPIDAFIADAHERQQLKPAPPADRETLIRRLSLDLTGLPPTPQELSTFRDASDPDAYPQEVERLLQSPRYGERMAQYWLDLVRYADTVGYHGDNHQEIWLYRDWVIDALNANMPFDQFTAEQLAGDLLPNADRRTKVASGYNRLLMTTREGGAQAKEYEAKYAADRVRNVSSVWLGATLGCAQCHDHKFDPYASRDFYGMAAFFADVKETSVGEQQPTQIPSDDQASQVARIDHLKEAVAQQLGTWTPTLARSLDRWEAERTMRGSRWRVLVPLTVDSDQGAIAEFDPYEGWKPHGMTSEIETLRLSLFSELSLLTTLRLVIQPSKGAASVENAELAELSLKVGGMPVGFAHADAPVLRRGGKPDSAIDGDPSTGWSFATVGARSTELILTLQHPIEVSPETQIDVQVRLAKPLNARGTIFRLDSTDDAADIQAERALPEEIERILEVVTSERNETQRAALAAYFRTIAPELAASRAALSALAVEKQRIELAMPTTLVTESMTEPRVVRLLPRGNWLDESGERVAPSPPTFLAGEPPGDHRLSRLDLARWMTDGENPLVARVFVNRIWKLAFGRGLVATADDFGSQGATPSHPELLDWLAIEFRDSGWDMKHLWRLIVTSSTYRQSSIESDELRQLDPDNVWLARQGRVRLDAEVIRDQALAASGLLVPKLGGPSVRPYQPAGYWSYLNFPTREYEADKGAGLYRRGLYTYWCRTFLHPSLLAFDAPTREECTVDRPRSNTPLQALVLLNDPIYVELSRALAERVIREVASDDIPGRIHRAFTLLLSRVPRSEELAVLADLYTRHQADYAGDQAAAEALLNVGERPVPHDLDAIDLAATTSVMRVLLNLHESLMRY